jgi:hypothetical protein
VGTIEENGTLNRNPTGFLEITLGNLTASGTPRARELPE